jgi:Ca-activated chloride channel family protein
MVETTGGGGTNMAPALNCAMNELRGKAHDYRAARLVMLTDGQAGDQDETLRVVAGLERQSIGTLGFGDFDQEFMTRVCEPSKGLCLPVGDKDPTQVKEAFLEELKVAQDTVASNLRLTLRCTDSVLARKAYIVKPRPTYLGPVLMGANREVNYNLPPLEQSFGVEILFDVVSLPQEGAGKRSLGEVTVLYDVAGLNLRNQQLIGNLVVEYTTDERKMAAVDPQIKEAYTAALDEELRIEYDTAVAQGDDVKANAILGTMRRSDNKVVADLATRRQTGMSDEEWKKQGAQATRRKQ